MYYLTYYKSMHDYNPYATIEDRRRELAEIKGKKNTIAIENVAHTKVKQLLEENITKPAASYRQNYWDGTH